MPKTIIISEQEQKIIELYTSSVPSTHKIAEKFKIGHKKVTSILRKYNIPINSKGAQIKIGNSIEIEKSNVNKYKSESIDTTLIVKCKKTGIEFKDANNFSGVLTRHILELYNDLSIPKNTYQRKKYEISFGKKWFEEYFDIIEKKRENTRSCYGFPFLIYTV